MSSANIYEYVTNEQGYTVGAYLAQANVDNADEVASAWSASTNYARVFFTSHLTARALHMLDTGMMVESVSPYFAPQSYR